MSGNKAKSKPKGCLILGLKIVLTLVLVLVAAFFITGSNLPIKCTVVDAETGKPIEGAIVLVGWSRTYNVIGFSGTDLVKVKEAVSDKDGKVRVPGIISYAVNPPYITVYKKGYVAWSNEYIFPDWEERTDFKWDSGHVFKLEKFRPEYTHADHVSFISSVTQGDYTDNFKNAIRWEQLKRQEEWRNKSKETR
jgi:hypothetical protein